LEFFKLVNMVFLKQDEGTFKCSLGTNIAHF